MDIYIFVVSVWYHEKMDIQKTALRLPKDLHKMVSDAARQVGHSMNAEIISRLRGSFGNDAQADSQSLTVEDMRRVALEVVREELTKAGK
jgi:hypothetical protein